MARNTFLSAGVYTREFDLSFIPAPIPPVGACVIGPTLRGPVLVPTKIATYSEYLRWFGDVFTSGSSEDDEQNFKYLTTYAVQEYLRWGDVVTVVRIDGGGATKAFTNVISSASYNYILNLSAGAQDTAISTAISNPSEFAASMSFQLEAIGEGESLNSLSGSAVVFPTGSIVVGTVTEPSGSVIVKFTGGAETVEKLVSNSNSALDADAFASLLAEELNAVSNVTAAVHPSNANTVVLTYTLMPYAENPPTFSIVNVTGNNADFNVTLNDADQFADGALPGPYQPTALGTLYFDKGEPGFVELETNSVTGATVNSLTVGNRYNIRWEIANVDETRGVFDLYIRRGDDTDSRKVVLEQFSGITLDPNEPNYIVKAIGDQQYTLQVDSQGVTYLQLSGNYPNRSRYVRVSNVYKTTMNYIRDNAQGFKSAYSASLPAATWGGFSGGTDDPDNAERKMFDSITGTNSQGYNLGTVNTAGNETDGYTAYIDALDILSNTDQYDYDLLFMPGVIDAIHPFVVTRAIAMVEDRGDAFLVIDPVGKGSNVTAAGAQSGGRNTNYAAFYWPWVQIVDADLGGNYWVPPSAVIPSVYAFNDYISEKWFAPAGLNRGGLDSVVQAEITLTQNDRDYLYTKSINPLATFPREGVVVWGQKTLQKKRSALDRINVRRLLIAAKRHVANTAKYLVFEQNTEETRTRFLNITRPFFDNAVAKQGIYDYRIIIDERNNTPDVIDRNEMRAQIYLKPAKTAEFIIVDFLILPTGAAFPIDNEQ